MTRLLAIFALFACLVLAACADSDKRPDDSRFSGFYGGMIGGGATP